MTDVSIAADGKPVVYFIGWHSIDVKIGFTRHLRERLAEIARRAGCPQKLLAHTPGDFAMERAYHARFASDRTRGEWFRWSDGIAAEIDRLNQIGPETARQRCPALSYERNSHD